MSELSFIDQARKSQPYYQFQEELLSRLLGLAYSKGIYEASVGQVTMKMGEDNMYMFTYENNMNQFEAAMLILGQPERWDQDFEIMLQDKFEQYHVPTYGGSIDENCTRPLFLFRLAVAWLRDPAGGVMVVQKQPTRIPDLPPREGEFIGKDDDDDVEFTASDRKAQGDKVEYKPITQMPLGSTIVEIILIGDKDEPQDQVIFNATRLKELIGSQRPDISELKPERIYFILSDGSAVAMYHVEDCCEQVYVEDIEGDLFDLIGRPLVVCESATHKPENHEHGIESETWTYYRIGTAQGLVSLRWMGSSNGYYGEEVSIGKLKGENIQKTIMCTQRWDYEDLFEKDDDE